MFLKPYRDRNNSKGLVGELSSSPWSPQPDLQRCEFPLAYSLCCLKNGILCFVADEFAHNHSWLWGSILSSWTASEMNMLNFRN